LTPWDLFRYSIKIIGFEKPRFYGIVPTYEYFDTESLILADSIANTISPKKDKARVMNEPQANNPLHCITLEQIVYSLVKHYGWSELGKRIVIRCFNSDPSVKSSLKFLRKAPWARKKVEDLYIATRNNITYW